MASRSRPASPACRPRSSPRYGTGRPVIGILAEFDALPGLSQDATAERKARPDVMAGHGCGHSVFGTASTGAAIAIKQALAGRRRSRAPSNCSARRRKKPASARPTCCAKALFKDVDTILSWHAGDRTAAAWDYSKAMVSVKFKFEGLPSHASVSPHQGKSALDAVELMSVGVNFMREHVKEDTRIHYVITNGGGQPNVVPPIGRGLVLPARQQAHRRRGVLRVAHRDRPRRGGDEPDQARRNARRRRHARSAAQSHPGRKSIQKNLELVGPPVFDEREKAFARATQKDLKPQPVAGAGRAHRAAAPRARPNRARTRPTSAISRGSSRSASSPPPPIRYGAPGTQLADRRLHRHEHRREGHAGRRQDDRGDRRSICIARRRLIQTRARRSEEDDGGIEVLRR